MKRIDQYVKHLIMKRREKKKPIPFNFFKDFENVWHTHSHQENTINNFQERISDQRTWINIELTMIVYIFIH